MDLVLPVLARRLVGDFLVDLRPVADAGFLPSAARLALPRLPPVALVAAFFLVDRLFGFCGSPMSVSTKAVTALLATSTAAFTFAFAASPIAS